MRPACCTTARKIDGPASLRDALLKHQDVFLQMFTENLMTYALGRRVEYYDMPAVRASSATPRQNDYRTSVLRPRHRQQRGVPDARDRAGAYETQRPTQHQ